jgi:uncharacterized protein YraI
MLNRWPLLAAAAFLVAAPSAALAARGYTTETVNMRAGPGTEYPVVATIPDHAHLNIRGCLSDHDWCDVTWSGSRGWVNASYLDYFYAGRYVYLPRYVEQIDVPIVTFALGPYWNSYYTGRPWYHRFAYWDHFWRTHGRYGYFQHGGGHRFAGAPGRPHGAVGPVAGAGIEGRHFNHGRSMRFAHGEFGNRAGRGFVGHAGIAPHVGALPGHPGANFGQARAPRFGAPHRNMQFGGHPGIMGRHFGGPVGGAPQFSAGPRGGGASFAAHGGGAHLAGGAPQFGGGHFGGRAMGAMGAVHAQMGGGGHFGGGGPHGRH